MVKKKIAAAPKEWDGISPKTISWSDEVVFASKDPATGENRKSFITVVEGLHDGFFEVRIQTPANYLNLKIRPKFGHIEAYHDNYSARFGGTNMNYQDKAYSGYNKEAIDRAEEAFIEADKSLANERMLNFDYEKFLDILGRDGQER